MKKILILWAVMILFLCACENKSSSPQEKSAGGSPSKIVVEKEETNPEQPFPSEIKIKLKRDGKDSYSLTVLGRISGLT